MIRYLTLALVTFPAGCPVAQWARGLCAPILPTEVQRLKYVFQFCRILFFCFLGEVLHFLLPLPIPASVYGLVLLLLALRFGLVKLEQLREVAAFLILIMPLLFVPATVGVMALWSEIRALLWPIVIAFLPVTALVMIVTGRVAQRLIRWKQGRAER